MFSTLLESKRRKQRNVGSTFMSATAHVMLVMGVVYATAKANEPEPEPTDTATYTVVKPKDDPPPPKDRDTPPPPDAPPVRKGFQTITAPIDIPVVIPDIDLMKEITNADDYHGAGVPGGRANGTDTSHTAANPDDTHFVFDVDKVARMVDGNPEPVYPGILKQTRQTGKVRVSFVIDTAGRADMSTFKVVETTNALFTDAVRRVLPKYRFVPAEIGARKVRMMVELPFEFKLEGTGGGVN